MFPIHLVPSDTSIKFIRVKWIAFALSFIAIVTTCSLLATKGLNFGIDFTGGTVIEMRFDSPPDVRDLRQIISEKTTGEVSIQHFGSDADILVRIQTPQAEQGNQLKNVEVVKEALHAKYQDTIDYRKVDFVGPKVGRELIKAGALALVLAFGAIMLYIWFRFEWQFGVGAVAALIHDSILTLGFFSYMNIEFNLSSIAAILTIIGYSINDSVVIYDRIRENLRKYKSKPIEDVLNMSVNHTLSRTLHTTGTTVVALLALVIWGGTVIKGFSLAVLFGVLIGTYSSIYVAAPLLLFLNIRKNEEN